MTGSHGVRQAVDNGAVEDALWRAAASAQRAYVRAGLSMPVWRDGRLVWIEPAELEQYDAETSGEGTRPPED
jgi:hypothetical protein